MILATMQADTPDGRLIVVSRDGKRYLSAADIAPNLLQAIEQWAHVEEELQQLAQKVESGEGQQLDIDTLAAPLPRSWQWLDGSAFATHAQLMQIAFGLDPISTDRPLMYQGVSDRFLAPTEAATFPDQRHGIDFEGEFGVIVDRVPMGTDPQTAFGHIKLLVQINDWSLRSIAPVEMKTGFGWVQAKPVCSMAPFAITPDELGDEWHDGRIALNLHVEWNGQHFGAPNGQEMLFGFHELVAHAALTRDLVAGTIIGSGTVSNSDYEKVGSSCISEVRAIEMIANGAMKTNFMAYGDTIRMEARTSDGRSPFGVIDQVVAKR